MRTLLLLPTELELAALPDPPATAAVRAGTAHWRGLRVGLCGMGVVDSAAGAATTLAARRDWRCCILAGIAGTYDQQALPPGSVVRAGSIQLLGVGAGDGADLCLPEDMGLPDAAAGLLPFQSREEVTAGDVAAGVPVAGFLTVCAASATTDEASRRFARFPGFLVEEMEAFAVARAARLSGVPFACLRGISNVAGDRRKSGWRLAPAMAALGRALAEVAEELGHD